MGFDDVADHGRSRGNEDIVCELCALNNRRAGPDPNPIPGDILCVLAEKGTNRTT